MADVTIFEHAQFGGRSRTFAVGQHRLFDTNDMNDLAASIQVPAGLVAYVFEHADDGGGYGISADFLEDCNDLTPLNLNGKISYLNIFEAENQQGFVWARGTYVNAEFIPGHWERRRVHPPPPNLVVSVSPPFPPHGLVQPVITGGGTAAVPASATVENVTFQEFARFDAQPFWEHAVNDQMGVLGSDFRGSEEIGSAAFERASNNPVIPDFLNFWYPQKQPNDHRTIVYFKRTLSGTIFKSHIADIAGTYEDHDLNLDIVPSEKYQYLLTDAHPREYTDIMSQQWNLSFHQSGQPDCDDSESIAEFSFVEAELDNDQAALSRLNETFNASIGRQICVYGPWIYDKGHCCHTEIHPAEQIWWSDRSPLGTVYACNVFCDESERFWWRDQMDDGTKLKPWGAPPITGTFAIAFEARVNSPAVQFNIVVEDAFNHVTAHQDIARHQLVYQTNALVSVVQDPSNFVKVSFENVGLVEGDLVRGFVVLEATVGQCIQTEGPIVIQQPGQQLPVRIELPPNTDPNGVPELIERRAFTKRGGRIMLLVHQGSAIQTPFDLNGRWVAGGSAGPIISATLPSITVDMSAYGRAPAHGTLIDSSTISVTFSDDATFTGRLEMPNRIAWSNGTAWTKM